VGALPAHSFKFNKKSYKDFFIPSFGPLLISTIVMPSLSHPAAGYAYFEPSNITLSQSHMGKQWVYRGNLRSFNLEGTNASIAKNIPCTLAIPCSAEIHRMPANQSFLVQGVLKEPSPSKYLLKTKKTAGWEPIKNTWSFAEIRYKLKKMTSKFIHKHIANSRSAKFLTGIATGDFDDPIMSFEFSRFGLQHIMAISGFHFAIIASILGLLLQTVLKKKNANILLSLMLCGYFAFLGSSPSVMRALIMILIALWGMITNRQSSALNSLGVALILVLLMNPLMVNNLGFQFSFITTAAILLFYPLIDRSMHPVFNKRHLSHLVEMDDVNQHGYVLINFFRQALALALSVNLTALPLTFYYFQQFSVLSLIYNLFFPFMVSLSMLLLILGLLTSALVPSLATMIHAINNSFTSFMLNFAYNAPKTIDLKWYLDGVNVETLIVYYIVLFFVGVVWRYLVLGEIDERRNMLI